MRHFDFESFMGEKGKEAFNQGNSFPTMNASKGHLIAAVITFILLAVTYYMNHPVLNLHDTGSIVYMVAFLLIFTFLDFVFTHSFSAFAKITGGLAAILVIFMIVMSVFGSSIIQSGSYRDQLTINEAADFTKDFKAIEMNQVPVIDKEVSQQLGDKKMGQVTALGSQYRVSDEYTLISIKDGLYRVSPLEYRDMFKWFQNKGKGIPGYVKINVTDPSDVELVELDKGMRYAPSSYLNQNLARHVRFAYPTEMITDYSFEVDDSGKPYWIISTYQNEVGFFNAPDATGVIILDPVSGDMKKYGLKDLPKWVDRVQPAEFAINQLENWGKYVNGFINTLFGQKDMLMNTDGYNYVTIDGQANIFTGVTSIGADRSIVGFALINLKNKEANFFKINGADEASAMSSAEGEVQNLGYKATFPIMLNISQQPTYFISLKDQEGLVKKYAFVSVQNYSVVGIGETVEKARESYIKRLQQAGSKVNDEEYKPVEVKGVVSNIDTAIIDGNSNYYITIEGSDKLFIVPINTSDELPVTKIGQTVSIQFDKSKEKTVIVSKFNNLDLSYK
ncbi:MAG: CvpA family protein [Erysipelotrichaceae bacterium]